MTAKKHEKFNSRLEKKYLLFIKITFVLLVAAIIFCHLDETVTAEGTIRPQAAETYVKVLFSGKVKNIYYKNTQFVKKNDVLLIQDCKYENDYLKNCLELEKLYEKNIETYGQLQILLNSTTIEDCIYDVEIANINSVYSSFINQFKNYQSELALKQKYYERQSLLYPAIISKQELENIENDYLQKKLNFNSWIDNKKIETFETISENTQKLEECQLNIFLTKKTIENAVIKANQSGYINEIHKINIDDYISEGTEILTIIPDNQKLKAIINISNSSISKIKVGQDVLFQIKDLPYTKFGKLKGKISLIPSDAVVADNVYFPVEVELEKNYLQAQNQFGKKEKVFIKVGTKVTAKVIVDKNTIFQKVLQKLVIYDN